MAITQGILVVSAAVVVENADTGTEKAFAGIVYNSPARVDGVLLPKAVIAVRSKMVSPSTR